MSQGSNLTWFEKIALDVGCDETPGKGKFIKANEVTLPVIL